jgi:hypothetical protein
MPGIRNGEEKFSPGLITTRTGDRCIACADRYTALNCGNYRRERIGLSDFHDAEFRMRKEIRKLNDNCIF